MIPANRWFKNAPEGEMLREMKHTSDTFERVLSLLIVPEFEPRWRVDGTIMNSIPWASLSRAASTL